MGVRSALQVRDPSVATTLSRAGKISVAPKGKIGADRCVRPDLGMACGSLLARHPHARGTVSPPHLLFRRTILC
jgi:hypothetical protein